LSSHYPRRQLSPQDQLRWLEDYADDLGHCSPADIRLVCAQWRQGDNKRMPSPGELLAKRMKYVSLPSGPHYSDAPAYEYPLEHRLEMLRKLGELAYEMARKRKLRNTAHAVTPASGS
jgi:hypothetical protein